MNKKELHDVDFVKNILDSVVDRADGLGVDRDRYLEYVSYMLAMTSELTTLREYDRGVLPVKEGL